MNSNFSKTISEIKGSCRRVLLAVSGGIDSMCMAELFAQEDVPFAVAHCNFRLRGEESDGDEALVRGWAEEHGVEIHVRHFDTVEYAHGKGISIEMAARELRYAWFAELCGVYGYDAVAVAHNANDNAETLILNLLRGAGMNGLVGMSLISNIPVESEGCDSSCGAKRDFAQRRPLLLRPLLQFTRKQIEGYMFARKLPYRNDSTNASSEYKRNRLRNEVFPIFEMVNPSFIRTFNREMGNFAEAGEIVSDYCKAQVPSLVSESSDGSARVSLQALLLQKHWRYLLYFILEPYGFNSASLASVEDLLESSRTVSGKVFQSAGYELRMERNYMIISPSVSSDEASCDSRNTSIMPVRAAGTYHFNGMAVRIEVLPWTPDMSPKQSEGTIIMDADKLRFPFVLRSWRAGDWFIPFGMRGKKKVSDLFTDLKYDSFQKRSAIMIVDTMTPELAEQQHIAGVVGARIDNRYKVSSTTDSVIRLSCAFL